MATKQVIEIDVTWESYRKLSLKWLIARLMDADMEVKRLTVRERKNGR